MTNEPGFVGLAEVIRQIRGELEEARGHAVGHSVGFAVEDVNLTFTVQVHRSGTGRGGVRIGVVTAELGATVDRQTTHQVQVSLKPELAGGERLKVGRNQVPPAGSAGAAAGAAPIAP
ncbi:trypco2 family protein [uncultured Streptomyces sp.]|uniref:trypco2 family protein n=1 Tax=uncultured Streptomyces sp. TaxID=174707 RepID=UPI002622D2C5|nr:trypco2 family protein [uncultured Streptomyces sp.]